MPNMSNSPGTGLDSEYLFANDTGIRIIPTHCGMGKLSLSFSVVMYILGVFLTVDVSLDQFL